MNMHAILLPQQGHQAIVFSCKSRLSRRLSRRRCAGLALLLAGLACLGMSPGVRAQAGVCGAPDSDGVVRCDARTYQPGAAETGSIDYNLQGDDNLRVELAPGLRVNVSSAASDIAAVDLDDNDMTRMADMTVIMEDGVNIRTDHTASPDAARANGISGIQLRFNDDGSMGRMAVILRRGSILTRGDDASGVALFHDGGNGMGSIPIGTETATDIAIHLMSVADITTLGAGAPGIHAEANTGRLIVDLQGGSITTRGELLTADPAEPTDHTAASGVFVESAGGGALAVRVGEAARIQAGGAGAHGIAVSGTAIGQTGEEPADAFNNACRNPAFPGGVCIQGVVEGGRGDGRGLHLDAGGAVVVAGDRGLLQAASGTAVESEAGDLDIQLVGIARIEGRIMGADGADTRVTVNGVPLLGEARDPRTGEMVPNSVLSGGRAPAGPYDSYLREAGEANVWTLENRYSARAAAFEALPQVLLQLNDKSSYRPGPGPGARKARGAWFDIGGQYGKHEPDEVTSLLEYNHWWWRPRLGFETLLPGGKKNWLAGAHIQLLQGHADDIRSPSSATAATINTDGYGFGFHLDWHGAHGMHAGLRSGLSWYEAETRAAPSLNIDTDAFGWLLEGQLGRTLAINNQTYITTRADLSYSRVTLEDLTARVNPELAISTYRVTFSDAISIKGRLGVDLEWLGKGQGRISQTRLYATPGLVHEFDGNTEALVGLERLAVRPETLWGEITLGGSMSGANFLGWGRKFELFGELSAALSGDSREFGLNTGVRVNF